MQFVLKCSRMFVQTQAVSVATIAKRLQIALEKRGRENTLILIFKEGDDSICYLGLSRKYELLEQKAGMFRKEPKVLHLRNEKRKWAKLIQHSSLTPSLVDER